MVLINKSNGVFFNILEELDIEEKKYIIHDILNAEPFQGSFDILDCEIHASNNWRGKKIIE